MCRVGIRAGGQGSGAGERVMVEGDAFDHRVDRTAGFEAQGFDRTAGQAGDQRLAGTIKPHLDDRSIAGADLRDLARQHIERAETLGRLQRDHHVAGADTDA